MDNLRITLIGKEDITRAGLETIIRRYGEKYRIVAVYATFKELDGQLLTIESDILLLYDTGMVDNEILQFVAQFQLSYPDYRLIVFSQREDSDYVQSLLKPGNVSFVAKNDDLPTEIIKALRMVGDDGVYLSREIIKLITQDGARITLTRREQDFINLTEQGKTNKEICHELDVTDKTLSSVRSELKKKLGIKNNEGILDAARQQGFLKNKK